MNIEKFSPTRADLTQLVESSKDLALPDLFDQEQIRKVKDARIILRDTRVAITKTGKTLREDALKFQKAVIAKEKELVAIVEPEEDRLAALEDSAVQAIERKARQELLPERWKRIKDLVGNIEEFRKRVDGKVAGTPSPVTDESLLDMDGGTFQGLLNFLMATKTAIESIELNEERKKLEARETALKAEEEKVQREKELREAEDRGRKEAAERAERERKEAEERKAREEKEAAEKVDRDREESERKAAAEKRKLEEQEAYKEFLTLNGWTEETKDNFKEERNGKNVVLWKKMGTFTVS